MEQVNNNSRNMSPTLQSRRQFLGWRISSSLHQRHHQCPTTDRRKLVFPPNHATYTCTAYSSSRPQRGAQQTPDTKTHGSRQPCNPALSIREQQIGFTLQRESFLLKPTSQTAHPPPHVKRQPTLSVPKRGNLTVDHTRPKLRARSQIPDDTSRLV